MSIYGKYGIALNKQVIIEKFKVQPVHYMNLDSPLLNDFRDAFSEFYRSKKKVHPEDRILLDYMLSTLVYMKPISGIENSNGELKSYIFQDECKWRYIPTTDFPKNIPFLLKEDQITEKGKETYSRALIQYPKTWIKFDWEDVKYIIVPDESALERIIEKIKALQVEERWKYLLISKIEISNRFVEDLT